MCYCSKSAGEGQGLAEKNAKKTKEGKLTFQVSLDTSLWKFHHTDGREVGGISPMCPDMGSACYSTHDTPGGCVGFKIYRKKT